MGDGNAHHRWARAGLALVLVAALYAPSLRGGFLNYDDDWLIQNNPVLRQPPVAAMRAIWTDLGAPTRHLLGAEYLPVRDTLMWLEVRLLGASPQAMRAVSLLLYLVALALLHAYLRDTLVDPVAADLAALLFAVHPAHVESVAWLAGQKDLAALLLSAAALHAHGRGRDGWAVPLVALAVLAKGVAVVLPVLFLCHDLYVRRSRSRAWPLVAAAIAAGAVLLVHLQVGRAVGMFAPWPGGSRLATASTMGPIWLRYLAGSFVPVGLTVRHEVAIHPATSLVAWGAYLPLVALGAAAGVAYRRGDRLPAFALAWFVVPLLPTSQVLAPLQNVLADRYLLLAVFGPCLALAVAGRLPDRRSYPRLLRLLGVAVVLGVAALYAAATAVRAQVFTSSVALWTDAATRAPASATAQYQLAMALADAGRRAEAEAPFRRAIEAAGADDVGRRAANNLSALLAATGRAREAQAVLRATVERFPDDPKALGNLAEITARLGDDAEARRLFQILVRRFPRYEAGLRNYRRRYGGDPP